MDFLCNNSLIFCGLTDRSSGSTGAAGTSNEDVEHLKNSMLMMQMQLDTLLNLQGVERNAEKEEMV